MAVNQEEMLNDHPLNEKYIDGDFKNTGLTEEEKLVAMTER